MILRSAAKKNLAFGEISTPIDVSTKVRYNRYSAIMQELVKVSTDCFGMHMD